MFLLLLSKIGFNILIGWHDIHVQFTEVSALSTAPAASYTAPFAAGTISSGGSDSRVASLEAMLVSKDAIIDDLGQRLSQNMQDYASQVKAAVLLLPVYGPIFHI